MDPIGATIASSVAGVSQAERIAARDTKKPEERPSARFRKPGTDESDVVVIPVEAPDALRDVKGNDQEESHEDRTEHGHYDARASKQPPDQPPRLDVEV